MMTSILSQLAEEMHTSTSYVRNAVQLLIEDKCTIPFVTRYRKEKTGSMDENQLRSLCARFAYLDELSRNKQRYLKVIEEHAKHKAEVKDKLPELKERVAGSLAP